MTYRKLTELQEKSRNAAHRSAFTHIEETNGWNQLDRSRRRMTAGDGSRSDIDPDWIWMHDRRWMTGGG
jgi:hypothetical protein